MRGLLFEVKCMYSKISPFPSLSDVMFTANKVCVCVGGGGGNLFSVGYSE